MGWRFIDLAALGENSARSYIVTFAGLILGPLVATLLLALIGGVLLQYGPIVVAGAAALCGVARSHRRPWRSLIAADSRIDWGRVAIGAAAELLILGGQLALVHWLTGWPWRFALPESLALAALALALIPLQAASEEVIFRGYLTQAFGRLVRSRFLIALAAGLLFGGLHLDAYGPLTVPYFLLLSVIFSLVSLRDERLELAIGGHAAMNAFAFAAANFAPLAPGLVGLDRAAIPFNWASLVVLAVNGALFYALTRLALRLLGPGRVVRSCEIG